MKHATELVRRLRPSFRPLLWLEDWLRDSAYALRALSKGRGFPLAAAATLAIAIGASTAMFSVLDAVLFNPLPYRAPDQLAMLWTEDATRNLREGRSELASVEQWRSQSRAFEDLATFDAVATTLTAADGAEQIRGAHISANLLSLLGVTPVRGRGFSAEEAEQRQPLVLIAHAFWQERFAGSEAAVGATIELNGVSSQIIGVLPPGFRVAMLEADVWQANALPEAGQAPGDMWFVLGRLRPNATFAEAQTEMSVIAERLNELLSVAERSRSVAVVPLSRYVVGPQSRLALWMLAVAVVFVFLIAAANVASLSLARSVARTREMALRAVLGASAARIVRQLLAESLVLAAVSGVIGTLLAAVAIRLIRAFGPVDLLRLDEVSLDIRVLAWALAISLLAGVLVGLAPAFMFRSAWHPAGEEGGRIVSGGKATSRVRRIAVVAELAVAIVLLTGAGLLVRSWVEVNGIDPGFRSERVLTMQLSAPPDFDDAVRRSVLYDRVLEEIRALPGVESAGLVGDFWIAGDREQLLTVERDNGAVAERVRLRRDEASAELFDALGTPLLLGRSFSAAAGPDAPPVVIVNETMARQLWPGQGPVGRRLKLGPVKSERPWSTVVGVVGDMRRQGLEREPVPQMFEALAQNPPGSVDAFIRTSSDDPLVMAAAVRAAVHGVEKNAPIYGVATLEQELGNYLAQRRFQTMLLTGFSAVALLLASVGIYGLTQHSVAVRTQEIGLRMAVGARSGDIFRLIVGEGLVLILSGLVLGLTAAWWLGRAGSGLLFGVPAGDPWTFAAVSLLLTAVALAACYFPARRATALDPVVPLRMT